MITFTASSFICWHAGKRANQPGDIGLGNMMYFIAGVVGIATKNGYDYGFFPWKDQEWFENLIPQNDIEYPQHNIEWGFHGFDIPDNVSIYGYMQSFKYIEHCEDLIRYYFTLKKITEPIKDTILMHYRAYDAPFMYKLKLNYYKKALEKLPDKRVIVVTDNIERARAELGSRFEYMSNSPIVDFYLLSNADYLVGSNSTFSTWAAWLSRAKAVFPWHWMAEGETQSTKDIYMKQWIMV